MLFKGIHRQFYSYRFCKPGTTSADRGSATHPPEQRQPALQSAFNLHSMHKSTMKQRTLLWWRATSPQPPSIQTPSASSSKARLLTRWKVLNKACQLVHAESSWPLRILSVETLLQRGLWHNYTGQYWYHGCRAAQDVPKHPQNVRGCVSGCVCVPAWVIVGDLGCLGTCQSADDVLRSQVEALPENNLAMIQESLVVSFVSRAVRHAIGLHPILPLLH